MRDVTKELTPEQKIAWVEAQIHGLAQIITCPYCGADNVEGNESLCCDLMGKAVAAVLDRLESQAELDKVARLCDAVENARALTVN